MDNSQLLAADSDQRHNDRKLERVLDDIIQMKRQNQPENSQVTEITNEDRIAQLEKYRRLEKLKNELKGRVLFEYDKGLETLLKEVIV